MVGGEGDQRAAIQPHAAQPFEEARDLDIHPADRAVVPGAVHVHVGVGVEPRLDEVRAARHHEGPHERVDDDLPHLRHLPLVLLFRGAVRPERVVGRVGAVGVVRILDVQEHEEGHLAVCLQPGQQAVDVGARRLARPRLALEGAVLLHLLEALVQVREAAGEQARRHREGRVPGVAVDLGQGESGAGEAIAEVLDAVALGVERGEHGRGGDLGPRCLHDLVAEQRPLRGQPADGGRGRPSVAVGVEMVST